MDELTIDPSRWSLAWLAPSHQTIATSIRDGISRIPSIEVDMHPFAQPRDAYNSSKLAVYIEGRPHGVMAPLLLHMMAIAPPDWPFMFLGTNKSVAYLNSSRAIRDQAPTGRLLLQTAPEGYELRTNEVGFQILTQIPLIGVSNMQHSLDDFLPLGRPF